MLGEAPISSPQKYPLTVRIAAVTWVTIGALAVISAFLEFSQASAEGRAGPPVEGGVAAVKKHVGGICCTFGIALAFIAVGHQTLYGKAKDTLGNGIGSILLGLLYLAVFILFIVIEVAGPADRLDGRGAMIFGIVSSTMGIALVTAGILALVGRTNYKRWRIESGIAVSIRRKR
jgi:hypothetical protein